MQSLCQQPHNTTINTSLQYKTNSTNLLLLPFSQVSGCIPSVLTLFNKHWQLLLSKHRTEQGRREGRETIEKMKIPPTTPPLVSKCFTFLSPFQAPLLKLESCLAVYLPLENSQIFGLDSISSFPSFYETAFEKCGSLSVHWQDPSSVNV